LDCAPVSDRQNKIRTDILAFVGKATGLRTVLVEEQRLRLQQVVDGKMIDIHVVSLEDLLFRSDTEGREFIQINFTSGSKILMTNELIGFKPTTPAGLDVTKLPRVVTTPDVVSVFEAIQDALHNSSPDSSEVTVLRKVYEAVLAGGEAVGFDLSVERAWLARTPSLLTKVSS
jgi:hypothetical protein